MVTVAMFAALVGLALTSLGFQTVAHGTFTM
jgi:hypothetical protein